MHGLKILFPIHAEIINNIKEEAKMKVKKIEINVSNDDTKYFVLKSGEDYDYYLRCMHEYMGERFYYSVNTSSGVI